MTFTSLGAIACLLAFSGTALAAKSTECTTVHKGAISTFIYPYGTVLLEMNSLNQLTEGNGTGAPIRAQFQNCPESNQDTGYEYNGRLVLTHPKEINGTCLTLAYANSTAPYYATAEPCSSDTQPSDAELWGMGNDFGNVIFWVGTGVCAQGLVSNNSDGNLALGPYRQALWDCENQIGDSYESFELTP